MLKKFTNRVKANHAKRNEKSFIKYLKKNGIKIGNNVQIPQPELSSIDISRPTLLEIGSNVRLNRGIVIMTHDGATMVLKEKYNEFINSSGKITIGNNIYFGRNCTVLKGVSIGDNCIIGYGSVVIKDIPSNSVAVGIPAKVICTLEEYYNSRKEKCVHEAFEYARSIQNRLGRNPVPSDFFEEFHLFIDGNDSENPKWNDIPIRFQMGKAYPEWKKEHKAKFNSFEEFLKAAGIS